MRQGKKHRDPGAVQRAMKKESAARKKDAEFAKKNKLTTKQKTLPKALQSKILKTKKKK